MQNKNATTIELNCIVSGQLGSRLGTLDAWSAGGESLAHVVVKGEPDSTPIIVMGQGTATELSCAQHAIAWLTPLLDLAAKSLSPGQHVEDCSLLFKIRYEGR